MSDRYLFHGYIVYSDGQVWSTKSGKFLKHSISPKGYHRVILSINGKVKSFSVHRLVAFEFVENPEDKLCVNHIDGNKSNNRADNLEWCTHKENNHHAKYVLKRKIGRPKLVERNKAIMLLKGLMKRSDVAKAFSVSPMEVSRQWSKNK